MQLPVFTVRPRIHTHWRGVTPRDSSFWSYEKLFSERRYSTDRTKMFLRDPLRWSCHRNHRRPLRLEVSFQSPFLTCFAFHAWLNKCSTFTARRLCSWLRHEFHVINQPNHSPNLSRTLIGFPQISFRDSVMGYAFSVCWRHGLLKFFFVKGSFDFVVITWIPHFISSNRPLSSIARPFIHVYDTAPSSCGYRFKVCTLSNFMIEVILFLQRLWLERDLALVLFSSWARFLPAILLSC